jgi:hypothetical protein
VLAVQHSNANSYYPWGINRCRRRLVDEASSPTHCVIVSRNRGSPHRVES